MPKEINQENRTTELLEKRGIISRKDGRCGWPDRLVLAGRRMHLWIEHKTERGRLTPAQKRVFPKLEAIGDVIIYARGTTPEEIVHQVLHWLGFDDQEEIHTSPYCTGLPEHTVCWDDANGDARYKS